MKITQEQIEAALRYTDDKHVKEDIGIIDKSSQNLIGGVITNRFAKCAVILAAAYRDKCEELAREKESYAQRITRQYPKSKTP